MPRAPSSNPQSGDLVARVPSGDNAQPLSITEISQALKRTVEDRFGHVRLRGELSGVKRAASGHLYCALKDDKAVLDAVMWRGNTGRLPFAPEDGLEVIATGKLTTYAGRSKYQIVVESFELAGEGALLALLEKTRARLAAEGLFEERRKRRLPFLPRTIGVVTSPTGSVIRDILHRLGDRFPSHVIVWPVLVQGQGAAEQIASAIRGFSAISEGDSVPRPDLVIVARGGGSIEDLWSFNEEVVVRAIAECSIPVISAVGHETDTTLADYAADRRAPTPTAAAEIAVPVKADLDATLADFAARQRRAVYRPVELGRERLAARVQRLPEPQAVLQPQAQKLDELTERLRRGLITRAGQGRESLANVQGRLAPYLVQRAGSEAEQQLADQSQRLARALETSAARGRERLGAVQSRLSPRMIERAREDGAMRLSRAGFVPALIERPLAKAQDQLSALARLASQLHPEKPLERGYAIVRSADGGALTTKAEASREAALSVQFKDGSLGVAPTGASPPKAKTAAKPARKPAAKASNAAQDDLFG